MSDSLLKMTDGIHHAGLTVPDLGDAQRFFVDGLGFHQVGEIEEYPAVFLSDGTVMITLWAAEDPNTARPFDRRGTIGLHHLALRVSGNTSLVELHERLQDRDDVSVEFPPEALGGGPTRHMMCLIPGDIRVEFIAPAEA